MDENTDIQTAEEWFQTGVEAWAIRRRVMKARNLRRQKERLKRRARKGLYKEMKAAYDAYIEAFDEHKRNRNAVTEALAFEAAQLLLQYREMFYGQTEEIRTRKGQTRPYKPVQSTGYTGEELRAIRAANGVGRPPRNKGVI